MRSLKTFAQYKLIYICIFWLEYVSRVNKPRVRRKCVPGFKLEIFSQINSGDKARTVKLGHWLKRSLRCSTQQETVHFDAFLTLKILPLVWVRELLGRGSRQDGWCPLACFKFTTHFPALFSQSDITLTYSHIQLFSGRFRAAVHALKTVLLWHFVPCAYSKVCVAAIDEGNLR